MLGKTPNFCPRMEDVKKGRESMEKGLSPLESVRSGRGVPKGENSAIFEIVDKKEKMTEERAPSRPGAMVGANIVRDKGIAEWEMHEKKDILK